MNWRFTSKIAMVAALLVSLFVVGLGVVSFQALRNSTSAHMENMVRHAGDMMLLNLSDRLEAIGRDARDLANNTLIGNALVDDLGRDVYLSNFLAGYQQVAGVPLDILVTNFVGVPFAANRETATLLIEPARVAQSIEHNRFLADVVEQNGEPNVVIMAPIIFANTGLPEGALVYRFRLADVLDLALETRHMFSELPVRKISLVGTYSRTGQRFSVPPRPTSQTRPDRNAVFAQGSLAANLGLSLVLVADTTERDAQLRELSLTYVLLGIGAFLLVMLSSLLLARKLTKRLRRLEAGAMEIVHDGRATGRFEIDGNDEVTSLSRAFNTVLERLDATYAELKQKSQEQLGRQEEKYRRVVEQAGEGLLTFDAQGRICEANLLAGEILGYAVNDLLKLTVDAIVPDQTPEQFAATYMGHDKSSSRSFQTQMKTQSGELVPVGVSSGLIDLGNETQVLWMVRDITERVAAMKKLERSYNELQQFAYVASHDLREPLRMVTSYLQLLEKKYEDVFDSDGREFIKFAVGGAMRMDSLIRDLLEYSRVETHGEAFQPVSAEDILQDARDNLHSVLVETGGKVHAEASLPSLFCDRHQILRLFQNLIENALKYHAPDRSPEVWVAAKEADGMVTFSFRDNGIGINPEHHQRIFIIFQRLHGREEYSGTGIGLAVCQKIVEHHGGRIWVESEEGVGSTFYVTLPRAD
ncbi:sensor histidine kinase [Magnetospira thiophila]